MRRVRRDDWRRKLHRGDEITWNDPDEGLCTRSGVILEIRYLDDNTVSIVFEDGSHLEAFLHELS